MNLTYSGRIVIADFGGHISLKEVKESMPYIEDVIYCDVRIRSNYRLMLKQLKDEDIVVVNVGNKLQIEKPALLKAVNAILSNLEAVVCNTYDCVPFNVYNLLRTVYECNVFVISGKKAKQISWYRHFEYYVYALAKYCEIVHIDEKFNNYKIKYDYGLCVLNWEFDTGLLSSVSEIRSIGRDSIINDITVIIPTKNLELLKRVIKGLHYSEIIVAFKGEEDIAKYCQDNNLKMFVYTYEFNYAKIHNEIIKDVFTKYAVLLNDDVIVEEEEILNLMTPYLIGQDEKVAVVGCKLLYPNNTIQHIGIVRHYSGRCIHRYRGESKDIPKSLHYAEIDMVTFALVAIDLQVYKKLGGMNEIFPYDFNDADYCLRVRKNGYKVIYNPECVAIHNESLTRSKDGKCGIKRDFIEFNKLWSLK